MAKKIYWSKTGFTGGTASDLDSIDGSSLEGGEYSHVIKDGVLYIYKLDATSGASESSPDVISPDTNAGTKRWILELYYPKLGANMDLNGYQITNHRDDHWTAVPAANYTAAPASTSTLTMLADMSTSMIVGKSLRYTIGGTVYYGIVSAITSNLLTVNGAPLSGNVSNLAYGGGMVSQVMVMIPGAYEDASNATLIATDLGSSIQWEREKSYCVRFRVYSRLHDTGTHGQASVRINGTELCTTAGGLTIAADATWYASVVDIDVSAYDINPGEAIEATSIKGGNGDAEDLTVSMIFVTP